MSPLDGQPRAFRGLERGHLLSHVEDSSSGGGRCETSSISTATAEVLQSTAGWGSRLILNVILENVANDGAEAGPCCHSAAPNPLLTTDRERAARPCPFSSFSMRSRNPSDAELAELIDAGRPRSPVYVQPPQAARSPNIAARPGCGPQGSSTVPHVAARRMKPARSKTCCRGFRDGPYVRPALVRWHCGSAAAFTARSK